MVQCVGKLIHNIAFNGFSVGFCMNEEKVICCSENNLPMLGLNAPVVIRAKDDNWSYCIQSKHQQVILQAQVGNR